MSDIFDLFSAEPEPPTPAKVVAPVPVAPTGLSVVTGPLEHLLEQLAHAVSDLPGEFGQEPDLTMLAYAVSDLLEAAGHSRDALAADRWAAYEASGRRETKIAEARARAEEVYRSDLTAIQEPRPPLYLTEQSKLPWRQPDDPIDPSRPHPDEHEP